MTEWQFMAATSVPNQHSLQRLLRAIDLSKGQFALILVRCNYRQLREQILVNLRSLSQEINLRELFVSPSATALHTAIVTELFLDNPTVATDSLPSAVMVFGLESILALEDFITGFNKARDIYADSFHFPVVLWLQDEVATLLSRLAPDFKSWAATTIKFEMTKEDLIALVRHQTESLFATALQADACMFLSDATLDLEPKSQQRREIESARQDLLRLHGVKLEPELEANLELVLGRDHYAKDQIADALVHFQRSLALCQEESGQRSQESGVSISPPIPLFPSSLVSSAPHLLKQAVVLFHIGLCYRRMADLQPFVNRKYWQNALFWFKQCLDVLEAAQRKDLVAKFILPTCEMLQRLQEWKDLQELAEKSLDLHQHYGDQAQVAQDYGFLAAVATSKSDWLQAQELANTALAIAEETTVSRQQESWYLLLLGRTQRYLGESLEAINNLEWAKVVCELQYEPSLYLEILEELRSLYFLECHHYLEAFHLKLEKIQIEHQYGFRAFIGASQLQPQRYRINPIYGSQKVPSPPEEVAQEITTSIRQKDVNRLLERITRADCKLTVLHGPSGVGKSSTLKAGLVPALKQKVIGNRLPLTIVLSVYTDWLTATLHSLNHVIAQTEISLAIEISTTTILEKLRLLTERNYIIIFIFDQFEEFFFINKISTQRIDFYKFLSECLNVPFVKVILSLREDYLHYLLDFERLTSDKKHKTYDLSVINKNILDKDIRYYLGNFSNQDAINIIHALTQRSHYQAQSELIDKIVQDLAGEIDEVHPIELQIVGAQLQAEKISTLEEYQQCGGSKKLVLRWLEEVIKDCGKENEKLSWKLLFELIDEKGTRPLKTKIELGAILGRQEEEERERGEPFENNNTSLTYAPHFNSINHKQTLATTHFSLLTASSTLELILEILVGSGLVLRTREESGESYQLVHDYLVEPIRQKNDYGIFAELEKFRFEKIRAEVAQKLTQEQLNSILQRRLREARITGTVLASMLTVIGGLWWQADIQKTAAVRQTLRAERSEINLKISVLTASSEALFSSNKEFEALLESLRAFRKLKQANKVPPDTKMRVVTALQQAVYGVTEVNRLEGHRSVVWSVAFSPDGKLLASGSADKTVKLWRRDGALLQTLTGHSGAVTSVSFSPDGQTLASASLDKTVKIWRRNRKTGEFDPYPDKTLSGHGDWLYSVNFSPDGKLLASGSKDGTIQLWSTEGRLIKIIRGHVGWVNSVSFSPDGQFLLSASDDKTVKIWRRDGSLVQTLSEHLQRVTCAAFSHDGQLLATGGRDSKIVNLWRREHNVFRLYKTLRQHTNNVWSLNFSPNGQQLVSAGEVVSAGEDNIINMWSVKGTLLKTFKGDSDAVTSVSFSPDNKLLASASYDKSIKLWNLNAPSLPILKGHQDRVLSVTWSPDGKMLASGSRDQTVKLWERYVTSSGVETRLYKTLVGHTQRVVSVSFDPTGQILASASYDKTVKLWQRDGTLLKTLQGHSDSVTSVSFSPDGQLLASTSKDKTVKLWTREGKLLKTLVGHKDWVNSVSFSPDSQVIASASDDQTVKLWRRDGTLLKTFSPDDSWVVGVSFSPTDHLLASASWDNTIKLWQWDGTLWKTLLKGYSDSVNAVTFSPNGETLAAASWDGTVKLWSSDGKLIKSLNGHHGAVFSASFSPDGQTLASANNDNTITLWNLDLNDLLLRGCHWMNDYVKYNRNVEQRDRTLCDDISSLH